MFRLRILFLLTLISFLNKAQDTIPVADKKTEKEKPQKEEELPPALGETFKPTIGLGTGMFSFFGDVYNKNYQAPWTSRVAYELSISQPLNKNFRLNFYVLFGRLGANEIIDDKRFVNFESQIRLGGLNVMYTFDNFLNDKLKIRPWVSLGVEGFEFLTKTDQYDRFGNKYNYWSDGSIRNIAQNAPNAASAVEVVRDYTYESDVREMNLDGFGKYPERSWAIPMGGGALMKIGERFELKMGATFHYTFTDYIDGISSKSAGTRVGNKRNDCFVMTSFSLHYDLVLPRKVGELPNDYFDDVDWFALNREDEDKDGVPDFEDDCHGTHPGAKVDKKGCAIDSDGDWIADHMDDEANTPKGVLANGRGVGYTDEMATKWYDLYYDSTGSTAPIVNLGNVTLGESNTLLANGGKNSDLNREFTIELKRFKGAVPDDEMMKLLSMGDVKSTESGDFTVYTVGSYKEINNAVKRKKQLDSLGITDTRIGVFNNGEYNVLTEKEVSDEVIYSSGVALNPKNVIHDKTANKDVMDTKGVLFRVQLGAYKNKISKAIFGKSSGTVIEIPTDDGYYRYVSGAYGTMQDAAVHRADMVLDGYPDAFITAYKDGKRIPLKDVGATYENKNDEKENLDEKRTDVNTVDKTLLSFRVQLALKRGENADFESQVKGLKDFEKQTTITGMTRFMAGKYSDYKEAVKLKNQLVADGYSDAFVIALFKDEVISLQEAFELQK